MKGLIFCKRGVFVLVFLLSASVSICSPSVWGCTGGWVEHTESNVISGGDGDDTLYHNGVLCGRRFQSGTNVNVKIWVVPEFGDGIRFARISWSCHGWKAEQGSVDWIWDADSGLPRRPAGKILDTYNSSSGVYVLRSDLVGLGASARVNFYCRCYDGHVQFAPSPEHTDTLSGGYCETGRFPCLSQVLMKGSLEAL